MSIEDLFDQAIEDIFDHAGVDAIFIPAADDPVACKVLLNEETREQPDGYNAVVYARYKTLEVQYADLGREPNRGEYFTVSAKAYTVQSIDSNDGRCVVVVVTES